MDHFQDVVTEYLRANRATFVNTECCIQLNEGANPDVSGPHWYCDAVAVNLHEKQAYLCEITYARSLDALGRRLTGWAQSWPLLRIALARDCGIPLDWKVRPWLFVPQDLEAVLSRQLAKLPKMDGAGEPLPAVKVTWLEEVVPWKYKSWDRKHSDD